MGLGMALGFAQNLVLARLLGPEGLGHVSVVNATMGLGSLLAGAGLTTAILRHSSAQADEAEGYAVFRLGAKYAVVVSIVVAGFLMILSRTPLWVFDPVAGEWMPVLALALPGLTLATCSIGYLQSRNRIRDKAVLDFTRRLVQTTAVIVGVIFAGFHGFVWGYLIGALFGMAVSLGRTLRVAPRERPVSPVSAREMIRFGSWSVFTQMLGFVMTTMDVLWVSALMEDAAPVGHYGLAATIQAMVRMPLLAYLDAIFPRMTRQADDPEALDQARHRVRRNLLLVSATTAGAAALVAPVAVPLVFGEAFRAAVMPLAILLIGQVIWSLGAAQGRVLLAAGWVQGNFWAGTTALVVNMVGNPLLIPRLGIEGAALATVGSQAVWAVATTVLCRRLIRHRVAQQSSKN